MKNALSLRRVPLANAQAHPLRSVVIIFLALAQAACVFGGFILVAAARNELSLAERRLGADLVVYPTSCLNQVDKKRLLMLGTPVGCHQPRSALARMSSNEDIASVSHQLYVSETLSDGSTRWIIGFEPETDFVLGPWMREGERASLPRGSVAVGSAVPGAEGQTLSIFGEERPINAHLLATGSGIRSHRGLAIGVLGAIWLVLLGALVVAQVSLMNERRAELTVWRSIGASHGIINRVMLGESALLHAVGALAGVVLAAIVLPLAADESMREVLTAPGTSLPLAGVSIAVVTCVGIMGTRLALVRVSRVVRGQKTVLI